MRLDYDFIVTSILGEWKEMQFVHSGSGYVCVCVCMDCGMKNKARERNLFVLRHAGKSICLNPAKHISWKNNNNNNK